MTNAAPLEVLEEAWRWRELDDAHSEALLARAEAGPIAGLLQAALAVVRGYRRFRGAQPGAALEAAEEALGVPEVRATYWHGRALNVRSCALLELGEYEAGTLSLREQLEVGRALGDRETECAALHDMGVAHGMRDPARGEAYLRAAGELAARAGLALHQTFVAFSLGEVRARQGQPDAEALFLQALALSRSCGHQPLEFLTLTRLGELALAGGDHAAGETWLRLSLSRQEVLAARPLWASIPPLVRLLVHTGRLDEARDLLERHLDAAQVSGMVEAQMNVHELLSEVHEALGQPAQALGHARQHARILRQLGAEAQAQRVRALEVLHRTELAQHEARVHRERSAELEQALAEREALQGQLERLSTTDELTGLHNRRFLMARGPALLRAQPPGGRAALALLDIDHFKAINDRHGHDGGDLVLRAVAGVLRGGLRDTDLLVRFGGEEFVVLLPDTPAPEAHTLLDGLRRALRVAGVPGLDAPVPVTLTAGLTTVVGDDLAGALLRADALLYQGKRGGRDTVVPEAPDLDPAAVPGAAEQR